VWNADHSVAQFRRNKAFFWISGSFPNQHPLAHMLIEGSPIVYRKGTTTPEIPKMPTNRQPVLMSELLAIDYLG
jgi:hypothetical protein